MKKKTGLLVLLFFLALTACGKKEETPEKGVSLETAKQIEHQVKEETEPVEVPGTNGAESGENGDTQQSGSASQGGEAQQGSSGTGETQTPSGNTENNSNSGTTGNAGVSDVKDGEYEETNDTVYVAVSVVNLRTEPSLDGEIVGKAYYGDSFTRLAKGNGDWDKLLYDGQVVYAFADYLSEEKVVALYEQSIVQAQLEDAKKNFM